MPDTHNPVPVAEQELDAPASTIRTANQDVVQAATLDALAARICASCQAAGKAWSNA
jgi:hypothetical protein